MSRDNNKQKMYSNLEMDFTNFLDIKAKDLQEESLFTSSMIAIMGNPMLESASNLTDKSSQKEIDSIQKALYKQVVFLNREEQTRIEISNGSKKKSSHPLEYIPNNQKVKSFLVEQIQSKDTLTLTKTLAQVINSCEAREFNNVTKVIEDYKKKQVAQTNLDLTRTNIFVIGQDGHEFEIKGENVDTKRANLKQAGLTKDDMAYLDMSLNQSYITGNAMSIASIKVKDMGEEQVVFNGKCTKVAIKIGDNGMASLYCHNKITEIGPEETLKNIGDINVITKLEFDTSRNDKNKVPTSVKVEVEHENENEGIQKLKNIPVKLKVGEYEKSFFQQALHTIKEFIKTIKSIFLDKSQENNSISNDSKSTRINQESQLPTKKQITIEKIACMTNSLTNKEVVNSKYNHAPVAKLRKEITTNSRS